jgi:hypothetical protein
MRNYVHHVRTPTPSWFFVQKLPKRATQLSRRSDAIQMLPNTNPFS